MAAHQTAPTVASAREGFRLRLKPGQFSSHCKLSDQVEKDICQLVAVGGSWKDACSLAGVSRCTAWEWKVRGEKFLEDPIAHPGDERFGQFVKACEEAELKAKVGMLNRIARDPDWRALKWLLINRYPNEFRSEHLSTELSGPNGEAIPISVTQPFRVEVHLGASATPLEFKTVDHRQIADQGETVVAAPKHVESLPVYVPADKAPEEPKLSPYDPNAGRLYERGIK